MAAAKKLHHLNAWERTTAPGQAAIIASGIPGLDELLPDGGWPEAGLVEIIIPDDHADAVALVLPLLAHLGEQERWLGLVSPPCLPRSRILQDSSINPLRMQQVNPHAGRSDMWTMEYMLQDGNYSVVLGWPSCDTELVARRLANAALAGNSLGILFRYESFSRKASATGLRLQLEVNETGKFLYRLNRRGERNSDAVVITGL
jgi:cell division inhibitor SulA